MKIIKGILVAPFFLLGVIGLSVAFSFFVLFHSELKEVRDDIWRTLNGRSEC